jgi:hypothetical protein
LIFQSIPPLRIGSDAAKTLTRLHNRTGDLMASNRGVVFLGPNHVEVQSIDYPKLENPAGKKINLTVPS